MESARGINANLKQKPLYILSVATNLITPHWKRYCTYSILNMPLFSHKSSASQEKQKHFSSHKSGVSPPKLDRARSIAATVYNPEAFLEEAKGALRDIQTIRSVTRPPPQNAGMMSSMALHGGGYTREELAMIEILKTTAERIDVAKGYATHCIADGKKKGTEAENDAVRECAQDWDKLRRVWEDYKKKQGEKWAHRCIEQLGDLSAKALGIWA
ncbi:hypothetical protein DFJ43DRAFT_510251 [Lentinula guzmanii]|uniref:Uncharacterized protein n=1 Tax=Lentinula guzmanii TaxID=2804957 RepID=A0AA38MXG9_9AGAR|nr:hypothetical protein DFJ43DRAFT_510251 [Lentinula guzmanii]